MTDAVVVELYGGPCDGEVRALPDLRAAYLLPAPVDLAARYADPDPHAGAVVRTRVIVYELVFDEGMRRPSITEAGRYRYVFVGYRC